MGEQKSWAPRFLSVCIFLDDSFWVDADTVFNLILSSKCRPQPWVQQQALQPPLPQGLSCWCSRFDMIWHFYVTLDQISVRRAVWEWAVRSLVWVLSSPRLGSCIWAWVVILTYWLNYLIYVGPHCSGLVWQLESCWLTLVVITRPTLLLFRCCGSVSLLWGHCPACLAVTHGSWVPSPSGATDSCWSLAMSTELKV